MEVLAEYFDYAIIFSFDMVMELLENKDIKENAIKLIEEKYPRYGLIYTLGAVQLETLKDYFKTYPKSGFIKSSKSPVDTCILFDNKPDSSLCLCIDYKCFNNQTIKN